MTFVHRDGARNTVARHILNNGAISRATAAATIDHVLEADNHPFGTLADRRQIDVIYIVDGVIGYQEASDTYC
jgi:hypothetical protein